MAKIRIGSELRGSMQDGANVLTLHEYKKNNKEATMAKRKRKKSSKKTGTKWVRIKGKGKRCYSNRLHQFVKNSNCKGK